MLGRVLYNAHAAPDAAFMQASWPNRCCHLSHRQVRQKLASLTLSDRGIRVRARRREAATGRIQTAWYVNIIYDGAALPHLVVVDVQCLRH